MTLLTKNDARVAAALDRIYALRALPIRTTRTQNELLASLPDEVLLAVACELKRNENDARITNSHARLQPA